MTQLLTPITLNPGPPSPLNVEIKQYTWYLDPINGNDGYDGYTINTPIKTWTHKADGSVGEFLRRNGLNSFINNDLNIYIMNDMPTTDEFRLYGAIGNAGTVYLHGIPTVIHSGVLSGITARNPLLNQTDELTDGYMDWTPYIGNLVRVTTATSLNANGYSITTPTHGWVAKALSTPNRARVSVMASRTYTPSDAPFDSEYPGPVQVGSNYQILALPKIRSFYIDPRIVQLAILRLKINMEFLDIVVPNSAALDSQNYDVNMDSLQCWECSFDNYYVVGGGSLINNSLIRSGMYWSNSFTSNFGLFLNAAIYGVNGAWQAYGALLQSSNVLLDPSNAGQANIQNHHASYGIGIYDCASPIQLGTNSNLQNESSIYGSGNTGPIFTINTGGYVSSSFTYQSFNWYATTSAATEIMINNQTALPAMDPATYSFTAARNLTFANLKATVASGGFQGIAFDPRSPKTAVEFKHA